MWAMVERGGARHVVPASPDRVGHDRWRTAPAGLPMSAARKEKTAGMDRAAVGSAGKSRGPEMPLPPLYAAAGPPATAGALFRVLSFARLRARSGSPEAVRTSGLPPARVRFPGGGGTLASGGRACGAEGRPGPEGAEHEPGARGQTEPRSARCRRGETRRWSEVAFSAYPVRRTGCLPVDTPPPKAISKIRWRVAGDGKLTEWPPREDASCADIGPRR